MCDITFWRSATIGTIPKFLKVYKHLQRTMHINAAPRKLLEKTFKGQHLVALEGKLSDPLNKLQAHTSQLDFSALKLWLTRNQLRVVNKIKQTHKKKLPKLQLSLIICES